MPFEREGLHDLVRLFHRPGTEHPSDMHGEAEIVALVAPHVMHRPDRAMRDGGGEPRLVAGGARGIIAAHAGAADGDACGIDIVALHQPVDAFADRHFGIGPADESCAGASVPPCPGPSIISTEMPRCRQPCACMNHISSLMESRPPMQISTGSRSPGKWRAHEIAADRLARLRRGCRPPLPAD